MTHDSVPPTQQSKSVSDKATALRLKELKNNLKFLTFLFLYSNDQRP